MFIYQDKISIRSGIVKNIPQHFDEAGLLEFFDAPYKVTEVRRLNRQTRIYGETKYILLRIVYLKFARQILFLFSSVVSVMKYTLLYLRLKSVSPVIG